MAPLPTGSGRNPIKKYLAVEFRRRKKAKWESVGVAAGGAGSADAAAADPDGGSDDKEVSSRRDARSVYRYWKTLLVSSSESARALARLALRHWMRPLSSASCERVFSYLTKMDTADRRSTGSSTLRNILMLRGNWRLVRQMLAERAAERVRHDLARSERAWAPASAASAASAAAAVSSATAALGEGSSKRRRDEAGGASAASMPFSAVSITLPTAGGAGVASSAVSAAAAADSVDVDALEAASEMLRDDDDN